MNRFKLFILGWLALPLPPCEEITKTLSAARDRKLSFRERILTRLHLFTCVWCRRYIRQIDFVDKAVQKLAVSAEREIPPKNLLSPESRKRIRRALEED